jgi:DNA-binding CsgD family transcriptional regulator
MKYTEIAKKLNITVQTLWNYRQYAEFNREVGKLSAREKQIKDGNTNSNSL